MAISCDRLVAAPPMGAGVSGEGSLAGTVPANHVFADRRTGGGSFEETTDCVPGVHDATLTMQVNGSSVQQFEIKVRRAWKCVVIIGERHVVHGVEISIDDP